MLEFIEFDHTKTETRDMVRRYLRCFDSKLLLLGHQITDLCERVSGDPAVSEVLKDDVSSFSLHNCIDRFLMNVLKSFLQAIDEGFADIIDEMEDGCSEDQELSTRIKRLIIEF